MYVTPRLLEEFLIALIFMVLGAGFLAVLFADFESLMALSRDESLEK